MLAVAHRFDPERGARFITFAGWHARVAIQSLILSQRCDIGFCQRSRQT
jgi:DNA-directed RNA polymerase sigma subunit (sigma70/sigma32)